MVCYGRLDHWVCCGINARLLEDLVLWVRMSCQAMQKEVNAVIVRIFRAKIREGKVEEFKKLVQEQSIPWLERSVGMLGYYAGEPLDTQSREFVMVTLWRDIQSLISFVGDHWQTLIVTADEAPLVEEMVAHHYERFEA
jgi:quinol monooxygenase YgiN